MLKAPQSRKSAPRKRPNTLQLRTSHFYPIHDTMTTDDSPASLDSTLDEEISIEEEKPLPKWKDTITPNKIIANLEKFVLSTSTEKAYNKAATDGISSSKRTLESLLARNGGQQNRVQNNPDQAWINNKNYTLDANGRVCLVKKTSPNNNRTQELLQLEKETQSLRNLQSSLMVTLELMMQDHRKMMVGYINNVNKKPTTVSKTLVDNVVKVSNQKLVDDFALVAQAMDETLQAEEVRSQNRKKLLFQIEMETFLMKALLDMGDIREASAEKLVEIWRSSRKTPQEQKPNSSHDSNEAGDNKNSSE